MLFLYILSWIALAVQVTVVTLSIGKVFDHRIHYV